MPLLECFLGEGIQLRIPSRYSGVGVDRLLDHSHHSKNTHLIVSGSIDIGKSRDGDFKFRRITYGPGDWVPLSSDVEYRGEAGDEGCVFVEGHGVLSPTTADRFEGRGTIVRVREGTPGAFSAC